MRAHWCQAIGRIAAQIDDLKTRIDSESRTLYTKLSAEIAALQAELRSLEAEVAAAGPDSYARQVAAQIEELRAKGDAAYYDLLRTGVATQLDPTDAEIRRLEAVARATSGDARAKVIARINELQATRFASHTVNRADDQHRQSGDTPS